MSANFIVYALHHPESLHVYVGMSSIGLRRPQEHSKSRTHRKYPHLPVVRWVKKLQARGQNHEITVLEECDSYSSLVEAECFYIAAFRSMGILLLNLTDGGEGVIGYKRSAATNKRIAEKNRGRKRSPETRARMRAAWTPERRAEKAETMRQREVSAQTLAILLAAAKRPRTPKHRANIGEANRRRVWTDESRAKIGRWRSGFKQPRSAVIRTSVANRKVPRIRINLLSRIAE